MIVEYQLTAPNEFLRTRCTWVRLSPHADSSDYKQPHTPEIRRGVRIDFFYREMIYGMHALFYQAKPRELYLLSVTEPEANCSSFLCEEDEVDAVVTSTSIFHVFFETLYDFERKVDKNTGMYVYETAPNTGDVFDFVEFVPYKNGARRVFDLSQSTTHECVICLEPLHLGTRNCYKYDCGHPFHRRCIPRNGFTKAFRFIGLSERHVRVGVFPCPSCRRNSFINI